jgi:hypothetical protein
MLLYEDENCIYLNRLDVYSWYIYGLQMSEEQFLYDPL